jgi:hypothetical protein
VKRTVEWQRNNGGAKGTRRRRRRRRCLDDRFIVFDWRTALDICALHLLPAFNDSALHLRQLKCRKEEKEDHRMTGTCGRSGCPSSARALA